MADEAPPAPGPEDMKPDGPPREPFMFEMMKGDDAGEGFKPIDLPPKEPDPPAAAPAVEVKRPSRDERMDELARARKSRGRRSFLIGLMVGQLLILAVNFGVPWLVRAFPDRMRFDNPGRLPLLVFLGVTIGVALIGALIAILLFFSGVAAIFKGGSLWRGIVRTVKAAFSIGVTAGILSGTAFFLIPKSQWKKVPDQSIEMGKQGWERVKAEFKK